MDLQVIAELVLSTLWVGLAVAPAPRPDSASQSAGTRTEVAADVKVKAGLLYNFAKFAVWPALPAETPIVLCVVGAEEIAAVLTDTVRGVSITGHAVEVRRPENSGSWRSCHLLFLADAASRVGDGVKPIRALPVLTVSDGKGFSRAGGVIEFYIQDGRMRFTVNLDALDRAGLRLSSRLLGLSKTIRDGNE
jgi:uncharacterized protein DUF4154